MSIFPNSYFGFWLDTSDEAAEAVFSGGAVSMEGPRLQGAIKARSSSLVALRRQPGSSRLSSDCARDINMAASLAMFSGLLFLAGLAVASPTLGGHEHVHIKVHIPHLINELHHQKKVVYHHEEVPVHHHHHHEQSHHGHHDLHGGYSGYAAASNHHGHLLGSHGGYSGDASSLHSDYSGISHHVVSEHHGAGGGDSGYSLGGDHDSHHLLHSFSGGHSDGYSDHDEHHQHQYHHGYH